MPNYLVRYYADTSIELNQVLEFKMPNNVTINVYDRIGRDQRGVPLEFGFTVDALCEAATMDEAVAMTMVLVEGIVTIISFSLSAVANLCALEMIIDLTPEITNRELVQYFPLPSQIRPSRKFQEITFESLWNHLDSMSPPYTARVQRAMRWYRKALLENELFDQFANYWTGLEAINNLIKEKHNLLDTSIRKCPSCGTDVIVPQTSAGIKYLLPSEAWKPILAVRNGLNHAYAELEDLVDETKRLIPILQNALLVGILDLLGIPSEHHTDFIRQPLQQVVKPYVRVRVRLHHLPIEDLLSGKANPHLEIGNVEISRWLDESGRKHERRRIDLKIQGYEGNWSGESIEVFAEKDPEDDAAHIELETK